MRAGLRISKGPLTHTHTHTHTPTHTYTHTHIHTHTHSHELYTHTHSLYIPTHTLTSRSLVPGPHLVPHRECSLCSILTRFMFKMGTYCPLAADLCYRCTQADARESS